MKVTVTAIEKLTGFVSDQESNAKITFLENIVGFRAQLFLYVPWHTREDYPLDSVWEMKVEKV